jgi:hypothetical protein
MDSPEEYIARLEKFRARLQSELPPFVATTAMNAKALIQSRIQERGLNSDEEVLGIYTSEPYKKKREKKGRQTEYVDVTFTRGGAGMLGSTGIVSETFVNGVVTVKVAGKDDFTQNKLDWNSDRYGDLLETTKKEDELLLSTYEDFLQELIDETNL